MPTSDFNKQDQNVPVGAAELDTVYDEGTQKELLSKCNGDLRDLKERLTACSQLVGDFAHELNNILTIISGYAEVLAISTKPNDPNQESIKAIIEAGSRA